jgi:hypothetical protein
VSRPARRRRPQPAAASFAPFAIVAALTIVAYLPSFRVPFQFDDWARITGTPGSELGDWLHANGWLGTARVLPAVTIALNYAIAGQDTSSYHVVNLLVHLIAAFGVYVLALLSCRTPRLRDSAVATRPVLFASAAALLFACHPLQTQAVTYIVQRVAAMAAMFYVWSVVAYVSARLRDEAGERRRARRLYGACLALAVAAVFSKENAVTLPAMLALTEIVFFGRRLTALLPYAVLAAPLPLLPVVWTVFAQRARPGAVTWSERLAAVLQSPSTTGTAHTALSYALTQLLVLPRYLGLLLVPVGLNIDHDVPAATTLSPPVLAGLLFLLVLAAAGIWAVRRFPLVGFAILWFFIAQSVESSFLPIDDVMMEHRMYLAMPGLSLAIAAAYCAAQRRWPRSGRVAGAAIAALLVALTFARNQVWQTPLSLWSDAARKSPHKARVQVNLGVAYHAEDRLDEAIEHYCAALRIDPHIALARDNIEIALEQQGRLDEIIPQVVPKRIEAPNAPPGAVVLDVDVSEVVCKTSAAD